MMMMNRYSPPFETDNLFYLTETPMLFKENIKDVKMLPISTKIYNFNSSIFTYFNVYFTNPVYVSNVFIDKIILFGNNSVIIDNECLRVEFSFDTGNKIFYFQIKDLLKIQRIQKIERLV